MKYPNARLIIFAKAPVAGQVKTRLAPHLSNEGAAELNRRLARHIITLAAEAELCQTEVWCTPTIDHPFFKDCQQNVPVSLHTQHGNDLGERMSHAFSTTLEQCPIAVIIGTDCPALTPDYLQQALVALGQDNDAVIGPAEDGGYVLLGLKRHSIKIFDDIDWGTDKVLSATCKKFRQLGWKWQELKTLRDIDRVEDLNFLSSYASAHDGLSLLQP